MQRTLIIPRLDPNNLPSPRMAAVTTVEEMVLGVFNGQYSLTMMPFVTDITDKPLGDDMFLEQCRVIGENLQTTCEKHSLQCSVVSNPGSVSLNSPHDPHFDSEFTIVMRQKTGTIVLTPEDSDAWHESGKEAVDAEDPIATGKIPCFIPPLNHAIALDTRLIHRLPTIEMLLEEKASPPVRVLINPEKPRLIPRREMRAVWGFKKAGC